MLLDGSPKQVQLHNPGRFFDELYHRLLWEPAKPIKLLCLQGMAVTYSNYHPAIGPFPDMPHILHMMRNCASRTERGAPRAFVRYRLPCYHYSVPCFRYMAPRRASVTWLRDVLPLHTSVTRFRYVPPLRTVTYRCRSALAPHLRAALRAGER